MDSLDKFLHGIAYKFPKGYPDMNDPKDKDMLFKMIHEGTEEKSLLNEQQEEYDSIIKKALNVDTIPTCKTPLELGKDFNLSGEDQKIFSELFDEKPASASGKKSAGSGNGEISSYWAFQYNIKNKFDVKDGRGGDDPDLIINEIGVEVKDYPGKKIKLGKFSSDYSSVGLLGDLFAFKSLFSALEGKGIDSSTSNPGKFKPSDLIEAAELMVKFKNQEELKKVSQEFNFDIILQIFKKINKVYSNLNLKENATKEDIAASALIQMAKTKLKKKPMLNKNIGYMLNVKPTGQGVFYEVTDEKINNLSPSEVLNHVGVSSSEIIMNFDALFK